MEVVTTALPGVLVLVPRVFEDPRGFFLETYNARRMAELGVTATFVQDNHSKSARGTLRGLHYQLRQPQSKLCRVVRGAVLDMVVDIRPDSPHFGQWVAVELSEANKHQIFVPKGFAHGFVVISDEAEFLYKCDDFYTPGDECGIAWDDPDLDINWNLEALGITDLILSMKDQSNPRLKDVPRDQLPSFGE